MRKGLFYGYSVEECIKLIKIIKRIQKNEDLKMKKLNFIQAMKAVFDGKKVRTNYFKEGVYIYFDSKLSAESVDNSGVMVYNNGTNYEYIIKERDLFADFYIVEGDKNA